MTHLTLLLLIDACRRDYLDRTSFLRRLAEDSRYGALREDFGFVPRAAYFGGLTPGQFGFTNMFCFDPAASPFGVARGLPSSRLGRVAEEVLKLRSWLEDQARRRTTPYAASYLTSAEIPIELLPAFDLVEKHAPWDRTVGYRSVFHELEDRGVPFFAHAWPGTNAHADHSDAGIVAQTLASVQPPCRFAFVHLQELDGIGHVHGPESLEVNTAIERTDQLIHELVTTLRRRFDRLDLVLFGDHGMVSVAQTIDVAAALTAAGLQIGRDMMAFLDSTMARFWFPGADRRDAVTAALSSLPGRVLSPTDLARFDLVGCDKRNGELIFLADPGVLLMPNFFQRSGDPLRGMHGYDPDCPDNQGLFLVRDHDGHLNGAAGVVRSTAVYSTIRQLLGLAAAVAAPNVRSTADHDTGLFTQHPDPTADVIVASHLSRIVDEVRRVVPEIDAVMLTGSFGRGEGAMMRGDAGRLVPVNDYDLLVVSRAAAEAGLEPALLRDLGARLAREFGTDFVHFSLWPSFAAAEARTLANYDLRHGSRRLVGDRTPLDALPPFAAGDLPRFEGVQLLFNRLAGLLTGLGGNDAGRGALAHRYLVNQTMKALLALGDWHLIRIRAYDASYRRRQQRFSWLASGLGVTAEQRDAIDLGYQFKLYPESVRVPDVDRLAKQAIDWLLDAAVRGVAEVTGRRVTSPREAADAYYTLTTADRSAVSADNVFSARTLATDTIVQVTGAPEASVRQTIYASIPLVAAAWTGDEDGFATASSRLARCLTPPWPSTLTPANWEIVRGRLAHAWLTLVH